MRASLSIDKGLVIDDNGVAFGILVDAGGPWYAGCHCDEEGNVFKRVGRVERIPDAVSESKARRSFKEGEGLRVVRDGNVVSGNGVQVGQLIGGNRELVMGMTVDTDGIVRDQLGNARGYAEPPDATSSPDPDNLVPPKKDDRSEDVPGRATLSRPAIPPLSTALPGDDNKHQTRYPSPEEERSPASPLAPKFHTDFVQDDICDSPTTPPTPGSYADLAQNELFQNHLQARRTSPVTHANSGVNCERHIRLEVDQAKASNDVDELLRVWTYIEV